MQTTVEIEDRNPVAPEATEHDDLVALRQALTAAGAADVALVGPDGVRQVLPASAPRVPRQVVRALSAGRAVAVDDLPTLMPVAVAAGVLVEPVAYVERLVAEGAIPATLVQGRPLIRFADLMAYKARRDAERREALRELTQMSQEFGLY